MKKKFVASLLCTSMLCLSICTVAYTEDAPMTEEETFYAEDYAVEAQTEEETLIVAEEEEYLEEDGLIAAEEDEVLEAAEDFDFNTAIPDPAFQTFLQERDWTTLDKISTVLELDIENRGIEDLTGIKYFTNLQRLYCKDNKLTKLDVSGLTSLELLDCNGNGLSSLNVSGCAGLDNINCGKNRLTSLDVSGCTALTTLRCLNNKLTSLDLSSCTELDYLMCYTNPLTKLNVSECTSLEVLFCEDNKLASLDVSRCTSLKALRCEENLLTSLDVSFCEEIRNLCNTTEPTFENGYLVYSNGRELIIDPAVRVLTTHEHVWDDGVVTKEATTTEEGVKTYTCIFAGCRQTRTESIPKLIEPPQENITLTEQITVPPQENITLTEQITVPKKPTIKKPAATKNKITVKWKHFKHSSKKTKPIWKKIKKVQVQCATDSAFTNIVKSTMVGKKKTKATIKGLAKKTTYYVRVRYYDGTGYSAWSKVKKVKTK